MWDGTHGAFLACEMEAANPHRARTGTGLAKQKRQSRAAGLHDAWGPPRDSVGHTWRERHGLVAGDLRRHAGWVTEKSLAARPGRTPCGDGRGNGKLAPRVAPG